MNERFCTECETYGDPADMQIAKVALTRVFACACVRPDNEMITAGYQRGAVGWRHVTCPASSVRTWDEKSGEEILRDIQDAVAGVEASP